MAVATIGNSQSDKSRKPELFSMDNKEESKSDGSSRSSPNCSSADLTKLQMEMATMDNNVARNDAADLTIVDGSTSKGKSLHDRARIPNSFYVTFGSVALLQYFSKVWRIETIQSWYSSMRTSMVTLQHLLLYSRDLCQATWQGNYSSFQDYISAGVAFLLSISVLYVFVIAPFSAGLWTGTKARKHKFHRYMGLFYLIQYGLAWVEFLTRYEQDGFKSFLSHSIALNGLLQASSAYLSFKVLPDLDDAGYYSDKAVLSRNFVHENIFFTLMTFFGSLYYYESSRESLRSTLVGRAIENIFVFWPYIALRTWYPITRFKDAGTTHKGRTERNQSFYRISTFLVKVFFLWAKYFLGFYMNFMIFLDLVTQNNWKFMHGMLLLNIGTVSLAMFLHTLRFKKILPPRLTFTLYLLQIYATFSAIPFAYDMFISHPKLCAVALTGLLCNMTRDRKIHAVWCLGTMILLNNKSIDW